MKVWFTLFSTLWLMPFLAQAELADDESIATEMMQLSEAQALAAGPGRWAITLNLENKCVLYDFGVRELSVPFEARFEMPQKQTSEHVYAVQINASTSVNLKQEQRPIMMFADARLEAGDSFKLTVLYNDYSSHAVRVRVK